MSETIILGLTGPTGAGKGEVAKILTQYGASVIYTDMIAHNILKDPHCIDKLVDIFGPNILNFDKTVDRKKLAKAAFSSKENQRILNSITHPYIISEVLKEIKTLKNKGNSIIVIDAPLLFESGANKICNNVIAVLASKDIRIKRIIKRDNIDMKDAMLRINIQPSDDYYKNRSDFIINSDNDLKKLYEDTIKLIKNITENYNAKYKKDNN